CHASDTYAAGSHHRHERADPQLTCASCHMPQRTYMVVDPRHDHGFRVPRPDLSQKLGTSNACNDCHADKTPDWAASAIERWHGPHRKGLQTWGDAFHAAWSGSTDAARLLGAIASDRNVPSIARASALAELAPFLSPATLTFARTALGDLDPMVRIGALDVLDNAPPTQLWPLVSPLLADAVLGVRVRAAALLAVVPAANRPPADRERFDRAADEFVAAQRLNADRPEARLTLGNFFARVGRSGEAEAEYKAALKLSPQFSPAAVNLADLLRRLDRDAEGEAVLRAAITASPRDASLHHALGLALTRQKRTDASLAELRRANELEPDRARYAYVYAVGLHSIGRRDDAMALLKRTLARHPTDRDTLMALTTFSRDAGDTAGALTYAKRLQQLSPEAQLARLIEDLQQQAAKPNASGSGR
ncbi:MAG TPA: tetratricopeptide repeat protein, partial [Burkholderiaceae bacterium]